MKKKNTHQNVKLFTQHGINHKGQEKLHVEKVSGRNIPKYRWDESQWDYELVTSFFYLLVFSIFSTYEHVFFLIEGRKESILNS